MIRKLGHIVLGALIGALLVSALGANASSDTPATYSRTNGHGPEIVIRHPAGLLFEDSSPLRLVDYDPAHGRIVYRTVTP